MKAANNKILVRVDMEQKNAMNVCGVVIKIANDFATNYREKSPVVGQFAETNKYFNESQVAIFHHNHFYPPSPYHLQDNIFSVPLNKTIFGTLNSLGEMNPAFGNMICEKIQVETTLPLPPEQRKFYNDQYKVINPGWTMYKVGQRIFTRPFSGYEIVYTWDTEERRIIKVDSEMVCGVIK